MRLMDFRTVMSISLINLFVASHIAHDHEHEY